MASCIQQREMEDEEDGEKEDGEEGEEAEKQEAEVDEGVEQEPHEILLGGSPALAAPARAS